MLYRFPTFIKAPIVVVSLALNLAFTGSMITVMGILKLLPIGPWQRMCTSVSHVFYTLFIYLNWGIIRLTNNPDLQIRYSKPVSSKSWNLVISNHQSWLDIMVLMQVLGRDLPPPKFFLKKELIWVPFIGIASWALDMPFISRYSHSFLKKNPHLKGKDIENTRRSCAKFRKIPTTIVNFVEGTRLTTQKHHSQRSPYRHLLKPKAGGIAFTLAAMGDQFENLLDVTIQYPEIDRDQPAFARLLQGKLSAVNVHVQANPIDSNLIGNYFEDKQFRVAFQQQLNERWQQKDQRLDEMTQPSAKQI
ncbi:acyltransferase [Echinimonas agarilytica]|uniref:Acyltransferase n=1 Tax=Echinimonas agarilytica TaxID=1215918 RepID=A0AA42B5Y7_9GAMM|nr:acyltransferase [Echinimonas agarilytica]MCM2678190.1 acyltransferase [Echinimonas agarilytica]